MFGTNPTIGAPGQIQSAFAGGVASSKPAAKNPVKTLNMMNQNGMQSKKVL